MRVLAELADAAGAALLDLHSDVHHNRSVFTLAGPDVLDSVEQLTRAASARLDLRRHQGVHPRIGVIDVVPFTPIEVPIGPGMDLSEALQARRQFAEFAAGELGLPCFFYGPERTLPEVRRRAFLDLEPDLGPSTPDPAMGAVCVGARPPLVAYNLVLEENDLGRAKSIAAAIRSSQVRALGLRVGESVQVSCNLIEPWNFGPAQCYDDVAGLARIRSAELVGLISEQLLAAIPQSRYRQLDVDRGRTIEARLRQRP